MSYVVQKLVPGAGEVPAVAWLSAACQWRDRAAAFLFRRRADAVKIARRVGGMVAARDGSFFSEG